MMDRRDLVLAKRGKKVTACVRYRYAASSQCKQQALSYSEKRKLSQAFARLVSHQTAWLYARAEGSFRLILPSYKHDLFCRDA
jgi:hypothetical protein